MDGGWKKESTFSGLVENAYRFTPIHVRTAGLNHHSAESYCLVGMDD